MAMWRLTLLKLPQRVLVGLVQVYRYAFSPWLGSACRFTPSCSAYALEALERHGALRGSALTTHRLLRCHPWCDGGLDPVPETARRPATGLFTRLLVRDAASTESPPSIRKNP